MVVMVSCIKDGKIFSQHETRTGYNLGCPPSPAGLYEVRVEGDGIVTEVKRGLHVFDGQTTSIRFEVKRGTGVHIVEYATGGLSREETAARLGALDEEMLLVKGELAQFMRTSGTVKVGAACCEVTGVDRATGMVTGKLHGDMRTFTFKVEDAGVLQTVRAGAPLWAFAAQKKVGFKPADPCCDFVLRP
jgi:hypothetical protein